MAGKGVIGRNGFFGQIFPLSAIAGRSPLAPLLRAYWPWLPLVGVLGLFASVLEGIGIGLLIPLVALLLADGSPAALPGPLADLVSAAAPFTREQRIFLLGGAIMTLIVLKGVIQAANSIVIANIDGRLGRDIRNALCSRILSLDLGFFFKNESARLVQIVTTDCWYAAEAVRAILAMIPAAITLAVFTAILFWLDWRLTLIVVVAAALIEGALLLLEARQRKLGSTVAASNHVLGERMMTVVSAIRGIRVFGEARRELVRFSNASDTVRRDLLKVQRVTVSVVPLVELLISLLFVVLLLAASRLQVSTPAITGFLVLLARAQPYAHAISRSRVEYASLVGSIREVEWLLAQQPAPESVAGRTPVPAIDKPIRFENVSYTYPDGTIGLDDIDFSLAPGSVTALVGKSGAGKSSVVDLLCRLVEPESGVIFHGKQAISAIDPEQWPSRIALAGQNVELVDGTIAENIAYGRPEAARDEIEAAAASANAAGFIAGLRDGYETRLGPDGLKLSGGERQRVSLARALLRKPDLLILDEATSAVDAFSEKQITTLLKERRWFRTALVISHRRSTLCACEDAIVLDNGRVLETGALSRLGYLRDSAVVSNE